MACSNDNEEYMMGKSSKSRATPRQSLKGTELDIVKALGLPTISRKRTHIEVMLDTDNITEEHVAILRTRKVGIESILDRVNKIPGPIQSTSPQIQQQLLDGIIVNDPDPDPESESEPELAELAVANGGDGGDETGATHKFYFSIYGVGLSNLKWGTPNYAAARLMLIGISMDTIGLFPTRRDIVILLANSGYFHPEHIRIVTDSLVREGFLLFRKKHQARVYDSLSKTDKTKLRKTTDSPTMLLSEAIASGDYDFPPDRLNMEKVCQQLDTGGANKHGRFIRDPTLSMDWFMSNRS